MSYEYPIRMRLRLLSEREDNGCWFWDGGWDWDSPSDQGLKHSLRASELKEVERLVREHFTSHPDGHAEFNIVKDDNWFCWITPRGAARDERESDWTMTGRTADRLRKIMDTRGGAA